MRVNGLFGWVARNNARSGAFLLGFALLLAAAALRPRPAITVVLTDGFTPWPAQSPKGPRVLVALLGDHSPDAPPWARSVRVPGS